jgi:hypothetical protein
MRLRGGGRIRRWERHEAADSNLAGKIPEPVSKARIGHSQRIQPKSDRLEKQTCSCGLRINGAPVAVSCWRFGQGIKVQFHGMVMLTPSSRLVSCLLSERHSSKRHNITRVCDRLFLDAEDEEIPEERSRFPQPVRSQDSG